MLNIYVSILVRRLMMNLELILAAYREFSTFYPNCKNSIKLKYFAQVTYYPLLQIKQHKILDVILQP